jgi:hypothetical protein
MPGKATSVTAAMTVATMISRRRKARAARMTSIGPIIDAAKSWC